ncbi:glyoxalase/bleomycin resistance/extradiol dioxygenase family protein [Labilibaculum filiforme]|uniref:Glyoxalase/bleomycin resistance/extradiol dioxygenase family protein n=1 Tax=Labilibaculum filiforme TaxID=1940526 RepID=A0A2N3I0Y5_9BACT|nr:VOC family protein [Labilibaculum filiforme]PKQ63961.1 glyoxalase/bleomycin resistance/extradiol dioxygenase family protein [Labilibaculum filiforme]
MKKHFLGLRTTIYKTTDLTKAKTWYSKAFNTAPYFDEDFYVGFSIAGYELGLLPESEPSSPKTDNILSYWGVKDINKAFSHLLNAGAAIHEKPTNVGGEIWVASVIDPWGNVIGIIYNPTFKLD